ncbi:glycogen debranching protein GlgX [Sedimenticola selenatireducens]|uniref:glycogen debranching protein GlgX n=1 Tax=Sedimenticola selenatireducens TaxID=191960 RepID=UPI00048DD7E3|nr:glycogen debranching protein GlgX [Sedimenticola selenatireducens]
MTDTANPGNAFVIQPGAPLPLGACERCGGVNFALFSRHAEQVTLLLFDAPTDEAPCRTLDLQPMLHRTGDIWHAWIEGLGQGTIYAWRVDGPYQPEQGHRFNYHKVLIDPYAAALVGTDCWDFACACGYESASEVDDRSFSKEDNTRRQAKCLVCDGAFDRRGGQRPRHAWTDTVIYETHVRGFTVHPSAGVAHPGTYLGLIEQIPYLQELGITAVELLPVQEFFEGELVRDNPRSGERLRNYWGYSTVAFFAPKESYSSRREPGCQLTEFKTMVRALHRAGIEVILDIVFNHTAEGNEIGPTLNFRGLDNRIYYLLEEDRHFYKNYSGTGNTLNCNHPVVRDFILDCLRHWVIDMQVGGFRFDLASVLGRDVHGNLLANPPLLERIAEDPVLRDVKLIAEAWDAGGAYQVGSFPGQRWSEWNGRFRDDVRRFWRGDAGMTGALASRLCDSADIYQYGGKQPVSSINFVTCHDGFTLNDLVSYRGKHNESNGDNNADGDNHNHSDNYGIEGTTDDPAIEAVRQRQIKNFIATLLVSRGVPMLLGGDEFRRSQDGNNNAYCQDNETSWYDWDLLQRHQEIFRFTREMIALRKRHEALRRETFFTSADIRWFSPDGDTPQWNRGDRRLGCVIDASDRAASLLCLLFNAGPDRAEFVLPPPLSDCPWRVAVDTARASPQDISPPGGEPLLQEPGWYRMESRSLVILVSG